MKQRRLFEPGDRVVVIRDERLPVESLDWMKEDKIQKGDILVVREYANWLAFEGKTYTHPPEKFKHYVPIPELLKKYYETR